MSGPTASRPDGRAPDPAVAEALRRTSQDLATLIPPMPAGLPARLTAALAAEAGPPPAQRPDTGDGPDAGALAEPVAPVVALPAGRHREARTRRRARIRTGVLAVAAASVVLGGGVALWPLDAPGGSDSAGSVVADGAPVAGGPARAAYDRGSLRAAVPGLLATGPQVDGGAEGAPAPGVGTDSGGGVPGSSATAGSSAASGGSGTVGGSAPGCLARVPVALAEALAVVPAVYDQRAALILIFPSDPGNVQVTVVSDCTSGGVPVVLDQFTAPR